MNKEDAKLAYDLAWEALQGARDALNEAHNRRADAWLLVEAKTQEVNEAREVYDVARKNYNEAWLAYAEASLKT